MSIPTVEDEDSLEEYWLEDKAPGRVARYAGDPTRQERDRAPSRRFERLREETDRQMRWGPLLAAAGAGFLIAIVFGPCRSTDPEQGDAKQGEELSSLQSELQSTLNRVAHLESEMSPAPESTSAPDEPKSRAEADASGRVVPEPEAQTAPAPEARSELTPEEVLHREPVANPEAAKQTKPSAATTPSPISDLSPAPSRTALDQVALAEPQQVAAVSAYELSDPAGPVVRASSRSGTPGVALLQALTPERAGWTTEAQPTLYWHASDGTQFPCEFKLIREGEDQPLVRVQLPAPHAAGIQRIELSQFGISLDEGASYRWSVSLVDAEHSGADRAIGGIRRVARPETLQPIADTALVPEHLDALERAGLWYDALDLVTRLIERHPGAENLVARRNAMLARVGIDLSSS